MDTNMSDDVPLIQEIYHNSVLMIDTKGPIDSIYTHSMQFSLPKVMHGISG